MAEHSDEDGRAPHDAGERARLMRSLRRIAAALCLPVEAFFEPAEGEAPPPPDEPPRQADPAGET